MKPSDSPQTTSSPPGSGADGTTVIELLERGAARDPEAPAVEAMGRPPLSYGHLLSLVRKSAEALAGIGVRREHRLAVLMPDQPETAAVNLTLSALAICVPLNPAYTDAELGPLMRRLRCSLLVTTGDYPDALRAAKVAGIPVLEVSPAAGGQPAGEFELRVDSLDGPALGPPTSAEALLAATPEQTALVLHTSGSTASPKIVPLTQRNLLESAANVAASLQLGRDDACLNVLPLFHVGALVDLLLAPLSVGGRVIMACGISARDFFDHVDAMRPTWYQGVPTMLQDILRYAETRRRSLAESPVRFLRSVSAPLPPAVLRELERQLDVPVVEIYGMTETAGVITSNPLPPRERRVGSVGVSAGPEIRIVTGAGADADCGVAGEVWVRGASVTAGYEWDAAEPDGSMVDGWLRTGDEGRLDPEGYLYLTGRIKDIINRGGEKIAPREIDELVLEHPGVRDAAAFALPHETLGEDVALAVVSAPGHDLEARELIEHCGGRIAPFKVPRTIMFCDELPRAPGGKLQRGRLPALYTASEQGDPMQREGQAPTSERQRLLVDVWQEVLGVESVGIHDDFVDLGGDSLRAVELAVRMSERLGFEVPAAVVYDNPTVHALEVALGSVEEGPAAAPATEGEASMLSELRGFLSTWEGDRPISGGLLVGDNTRGDRPPLFWGVQSFGEHREFATRLGPDQPVYAMRSLHRMKSKSAENSVALARHYLAEIVALKPKGPVHLGGYCAGGGIALHVARGLQAMGREVASLCLIEHFSPEPYDGRVAFFFHVDGGYHPFRTAEPDWFESYTGHVSMHPSHAGHDGVLVDPEVISAVRRELDQAGPARASAPQDCSASVHVSARRVVVSRASIQVELLLENTGATSWELGTSVFSRWGRPGSPRVSFDASSILAEEVVPHGTVEVSLEVLAPLSPGVWCLSFDIVPGGDWNGDPKQVGRTIVTVLPGAAALSYIRERLLRVAPRSLLRRSAGKTT